MSGLLRKIVVPDDFVVVRSEPSSAASAARVGTLRAADEVKQRERVPEQSEQKLLVCSASELAEGASTRRIRGVGVELLEQQSRKGPKGSSSPALPPRLCLNPVVTHTFRFQAGNGGTQSITCAEVLQACGMIATAANTLRPIATSFKLHSIVMWPALSTSSVDSVSVEWAAAQQNVKDEILNVLLPEGQTLSKPLRFTPPKESYAAFWQQSSSTNFMFTTAPVGTILDMNLSFTLAAALPTPSAITTAGAVTVGGLYYGYLDGVTTHNWGPPASLPSQF